MVTTKSNAIVTGNLLQTRLGCFAKMITLSTMGEVLLCVCGTQEN